MVPRYGIAWKIGFHLVSQRLRSLLWNLEGSPGQLALLASDDDNEVRAGLSRLQQMHITYTTAFDQADARPFVKSQVAESFMSTPIPKQANMVLRRHNYTKVPDALKQGIIVFFSQGNTRMIEQAFRADREIETRAQAHMQVGRVRQWIVPVQKQILTQVNRFAEIAHTEFTPQMMSEIPKQTVCKALFNPKKIQPKLPLRHVVANKNPDWATTSAQGLTKMYASMAMWRHCEKSPRDWGQLPNSWLSRLASCGTFFRRSGSNNPWFCSLGCVEGMAVLCWKAQRVRIGDSSYFKLSLDSTETDRPYEWQVVVDLNQYQAQPISIKSPLRWFSEHSGANSSSSSSAAPAFGEHVFLEAEGEPTSLLRVAGLQCFPEVPFSMLDKLMRYLNLDLPAGSSVFDKMKQLVSFAVPGAS